jgi:hypothetical protein
MQRGLFFCDLSIDGEAVACVNVFVHMQTQILRVL